MIANADTAPPWRRSAPQGPRPASVGIQPPPSGRNNASKSGTSVLGLGHGAAFGARHQAGVLGQGARRVPGLGQLPVRPAPLELGGVDHEVDGAGLGVVYYAVTVLAVGNGAAIH